MNNKQASNDALQVYGDAVRGVYRTYQDMQHAQQVLDEARSAYSQAMQEERLAMEALRKILRRETHGG